MAISLVEMFCVTFLYICVGFIFLTFEILEHRNSQCHNHQVRLSKMTIEHILKHSSLIEVSCVTFFYKSLGFVVDLETINYQNPKCRNYQIGLQDDR
jgi:hypothetical protein